MELIKIAQTAGMETVNARELHGFLESGTEFSHWITRRIEKYGFVDGTDFVTVVKKDGRQTSKEYHVSVNMAKELAMVENNSRGREARLYFIDCEKQMKTGQYLTVRDIPMIVAETIKAIIPLVRELRAPEKPKDKYQRIGEWVADKARAKAERKEMVDKIYPDLFR